jgi:hypothetical protein
MIPTKTRQSKAAHQLAASFILKKVPEPNENFRCVFVRDRTDNYKLAVTKYRMGQAERPTCPGCGAFLILALPPGGRGPRAFQCLDCECPDPLRTDQVMGWLKGELHPPK